MLKTILLIPGVTALLLAVNAWLKNRVHETAVTWKSKRIRLKNQCMDLIEKDRLIYR